MKAAQPMHPCPRPRASALRALGACALVAVALASAASGETVVLCLGDSLTEGYGVEPEAAWPQRLEAHLQAEGRKVRVINAGISGSTTASAASRLRWQLRAEPDLLVLALGGNDGLRGLDLVETERNLARAIELAKQQGVQVLLAGMKIPPNYGPDYTRRFEALFPALASRYDIALIPFLLEGVAAQPDLNLPDGIHPNADGHRRVAENVLESVRPLLAGAP